MRELVVRVDGSKLIGFGHAVRCLALVQAWNDSGGRATVVTAELPDSVRSSLLSEQATILDIPGPDAVTPNFRRALEQADWTVFDSYTISSKIRSLAIDHESRLLVIDDFGSSPKPIATNILLDQNIGVTTNRYEDDLVGQFLLGTNYALLRRIFRQGNVPERTTASRRMKILVATGGTIRPNITKVLQNMIVELEQLGHQVTVAGSSFGESTLPFDKFPSTLLETDLAVTASGTTIWELLWAGIPVVAIPIANNQEPIAAHLAGIGAAVTLDPKTPNFETELLATVKEVTVNEELQASLSDRGRDLVDGQGAERVTQIMLEGIN